MERAYRHLSLDERIEIDKGLEAGESMRSIGRRLNRDVSTISREAQRGQWLPVNESQAYKPYKTTKSHGPWQVRRYAAGPSHRRATKRAQLSHQPRLFTCDEVVTLVARGLEKGWSPAMIAGRAPRSGIRISHEAIYQWIYATPARAAQWSPYLVRGHKKRRRHHGRRVHASHIPFRISIHARPAVIDTREQFGHWEGDTVLGAKTDKNGIHTETERMTRFLMAAKVDDLTSATTAATQLAMFTGLPAHAARSVTVDNGTENHASWILDTLAMPVYHADPYSSWQRGTNEHYNGVIRRYLPKGTSLAGVTGQDLADIVTEINNRPAKCLAWDTPAEAFTRLCLDPHATVALQS